MRALSVLAISLTFISEEDWARHKPSCTLTVNFGSPNPAGERPVQRHLRLWTSRFNTSLLCATIVALELNKHAENIDKVGLVISLRPRPHLEAAARFEFVDAAVEPLTKIEEIMGYHRTHVRSANTAPHPMEIHQQVREKLRKKTNGEADYAAVVAIAQNFGPHALPEIRSASHIMSYSLTVVLTAQ